MGIGWIGVKKFRNRRDFIFKWFFMDTYSATYRVRVSDVDLRGRIKLSSLLSLLQEAATDHAEQLGVGRKHLFERGLGWALSKMVLNVRRLPRWGERLTIKTWPGSRTVVAANREFVLSTDDGRTIATARTLWVLFDLGARRIAKLDLLGSWPSIDERADDSQFERPHFPQTGELLTAVFGVRKDDIDLNGHVNNAVYITWALEPLSLAFWQAHEPSHIALWFLSEVLPEAQVSSQCIGEGDTTYHRLLADGAERARAFIRWRPLPENEFLS